MSGLSVDVGLLKIMSFGLVIIVWVRVMCCCWLFDNCEGYFVLCEVILSFCSICKVFFWVSCFGMLNILYRVRVMLFIMLRW